MRGRRDERHEQQPALPRHERGSYLPPGRSHQHADPPGDTFDYTVQIPGDEPIGLYWYHPHPHGCSNGQVQGGAAGALRESATPPGTYPLAVRGACGSSITHSLAVTVQVH
ncbi:MAG: multicopper oxidase domain-containing protein [Gammaproteobacteria bacterium]|nr:multicopper oxidase domain-containing protein [Gammaproteobacteria bacterium]